MVLVGDRRVGFDFLFGIDTPAVWIQQVGVGEPEFASWNRLADWLRSVQHLKAVA
jgi:hypothetical protein